jgi:peptidoglycan/xylan/chitin deacetylase (PgdA/CDA1 family)
MLSRTKIIRNLTAASPSAPTVYLTFDDGPDPATTGEVLKILKEHKAHATFFIVANRAKAQKSLLNAIVGEGHAIGNHSLDHHWQVFFRSRETMRAWIAAAEDEIRSYIGAPTVGFRSPAGIVTPPLLWALEQLKMPLIHWNQRFYDTAFTFRASAALRAAGRVKAGDIVLFHDRQSPQRRQEFLKALSTYITSLKSQKFELRPIPR